VRTAQGARLAWSPSSAVFREYALRMVRAIANRYGSHPALRLWHVSNEIGNENARCYSEETAVAWQAWLLAKKTGTAPVIDLGRVPLRFFVSSALSDGIRIRPDRLRLAFADDGALADKLRIDLTDDLFERLNRPEDVSFRYSIFDSGRGRELQNQLLHNIAGLGSADGDRPFKRLAGS